MKPLRRLALLTPTLALMAALAGAAPAAAAILPGVAVDGPSNLIDSVRPDVEVAPDNSAALVYLKSDGGVNHPFVSRFTGGAWGAPQRVDTGSGVAASNARIAVANGGKVVVAYLRGGDAVARISAAPGAPFGAERIIQAGAGNVDVDLSPGGNGYAVVEASTDILAERLEGETWSEVGIGALNVDETQEAGSGNRLVRVAASADGTGGAIAWGEEIGGSMDDVEVYVRRLTGSTPGNALGTRLPPGSLPNSNAGSGKVADQPAVDMDGTGTIWVVFRQNFEYGMSIRHRAIARPITGETVGAGQVVDNMGDAPTVGRDFQQVDVNGPGQGLVTHHGNLGNPLEWASLAGGTWTPGGLVNLSDNASSPQAIPALGENGSGLIAYAFKSGTGANTAKRTADARRARRRGRAVQSRLRGSAGRTRRLRRVGCLRSRGVRPAGRPRRDNASPGRRGRRPAAAGRHQSASAAPGHRPGRHGARSLEDPLPARQRAPERGRRQDGDHDPVHDLRGGDGQAALQAGRTRAARGRQVPEADAAQSLAAALHSDAGGARLGVAPRAGGSTADQVRRAAVGAAAPPAGPLPAGPHRA